MTIGDPKWNCGDDGMPVGPMEIEDFEHARPRQVLRRLVQREHDTANIARDVVETPHDPYLERYNAGRVAAYKQVLGMLETLPAKLKEARNV